MADDEAEEVTTGTKAHNRMAARTNPNIKKTTLKIAMDDMLVPPVAGNQFHSMRVYNTTTVTVPQRLHAAHDTAAGEVATEPDVDIVNGFRAYETKTYHGMDEVSNDTFFDVDDHVDANRRWHPIDEDDIENIHQSTDERPNLSYAKLAAMAIRASPNGRCVVSEIYAYVKQRYPFYQGQGAPYWKNCIRHNLSTNKIFIRHKEDCNQWSIRDDDRLKKETPHRRKRVNKQRVFHNLPVAQVTKQQHDPQIAFSCGIPSLVSKYHTGIKSIQQQTTAAPCSFLPPHDAPLLPPHDTSLRSLIPPHGALTNFVYSAPAAEPCSFPPPPHMGLHQQVAITPLSRNKTDFQTIIDMPTHDLDAMLLAYTTPDLI